MIAEGQEAPDFTLTSDARHAVSLRDFRGKKVVLYFYPKDGTSGCTKEAQAFRDAIQDFEAANAVIVGVSKDSIESHRRFKQKHALPFTLLSDPNGDIMHRYGVWKEKRLYGRTFMGVERSTFLIDEKGVVQKIYRKVRVKGHAQVCLLDLKTPP